MKYLILTFALLIPAYSYSDWKVDCSNIKLDNQDIKHCARKNDENKKANYLFEYEKLIKDISKQVAKTDNITSEYAIKQIKKSHKLWINLITIDCDLWANSPLNSGSRNPDKQECLAEKYNKRIEQIKIYREAWII